MKPKTYFGSESKELLKCQGNHWKPRQKVQGGPWNQAT